MNYRAEIDGLRALAVLPVIFFHAGFDVFSGGFVGVDVFFVISGYLITTIIIDKHSKGDFKLNDFYVRRARRILPALIFIIAICIPFSWMLMSPTQLVDFSKSILSLFLFSSNIYFLSELDYFAPSAELQPLLHTWSLSVEEQFYLIFPLLLIFLYKLGIKRAIGIIAFITLLSFLFAEWAIGKYLEQSFFFSLNRFWEIFLGSISAFLIHSKGFKSNNYFSAIGFLLIFLSIFSFDKDLPYPGSYTLIPVFGTMLIILYGGGGTIVGNLLSARPLVTLGLISYSAYLWHQPLFSFTRIRFGHDIGENFYILLSFLAIALAYLTWRYIEVPFRIPGVINIKLKRMLTVFSLIFFLIFSIFGILTNGFKSRVEGLKEFEVPIDRKSVFCNADGRKSLEELKNNQFCVIGSGEPSVAIIGDSHAGAIFDAADKHFSKIGVSSLAISGGFCVPILNGFDTVRNCKDLTSAAFDSIISRDEINTIILVAEWAVYTKGYRGLDRPRLWTDNGGRAVSVEDIPILFHRSFMKTLDKLSDANKTVIVIHPVPEFNHEPMEWATSAVLNDTAIDFQSAIRILPSLSLKEYYLRNSDVLKTFETDHSNVHFLPVNDIFCDEVSCSQLGDNFSILYSDTNHLNALGAKLVFDKMMSKYNHLF